MKKQLRTLPIFFLKSHELTRVHRTYRFAILGLSLSSLLDINQPHDLLRGLINTITEFDQSKEEGENKSKMVSLIRRLYYVELTFLFLLCLPANKIQQKQKREKGHIRDS